MTNVAWTNVTRTVVTSLRQFQIPNFEFGPNCVSNLRRSKIGRLALGEEKEDKWSKLEEEIKEDANKRMPKEGTQESTKPKRTRKLQHPVLSET